MIRRLELHNFATHPDTEIEFGNSKNIVIGETGSGKTNLLQAIDFAFLGEVQGTTLPELIADGADSAEVFLDYVDQRSSQAYRIHRTLSRDSDGKTDHTCSITNLETNEVTKNPEPVRKTLEALGVEQSVFKNVVHVPQGRFADILQETIDRKAVLDRLFRISQLENTYHDLGLREGPITQLEKRRQDKQLEKTKLKETADRLTQEEEQLQNLTIEQERQQQQLGETRKKLDQLNKITQPVEQKLSTFTDLNKKLERAKTLSDIHQDQATKLLTQLHETMNTDDYKKTTANSQTTLSCMKELEAELPALSQQRDNLEREHQTGIEKAAATKSKHDAAIEQKGSLQKQLDDIHQYLQGKGERPNIECDKCGSILTPEQWTKHIEETTKKRGELEVTINELKEQQLSDTQLSKDIQKKLEEAKTTLDKQNKNIGTLQQLATQREAAEKATNTQTQVTEQMRTTLREFRKLLDIDPTESDDKVVQTAQLIQSQIGTIPNEIQRMETDLTTYDVKVLEPQRTRVNEAKTAAERIKELEPQIRVDTKKIELLQTIRNAFREIQPAVRRNFVNRITTSANDYLRRLYGGSEIENFEFSEDYEFIVTRAGHKRHAYRLSGGQQVLASMAFLMALSEVLSELDFLILDEPTTHLDENRRKELVNVLENLRRVPQLIIVDHHPELLAAADTRFQATLNADGQSQVLHMNEQ
jgi:exonuclease SbcC